MDLFQLANNALSRVCKKEILKLYRFAKQENIAGLVTPFYNETIEILGYSQVEKDGGLRAESGYLKSSSMRRFYIFSNKESVFPSLLNNDKARAGDILERSDGSKWYVSEVIDNYTDNLQENAWICVLAYEQNSEKEICIIPDDSSQKA